MPANYTTLIKVLMVLGFKTWNASNITWAVDLYMLSKELLCLNLVQAFVVLVLDTLRPFLPNP